MPIAGPVVFSNFSFRRVEYNKLVLIPANQQMLVYGGLTIEGDIILEGDIVLL